MSVNMWAVPSVNWNGNTPIFTEFLKLNLSEATGSPSDTSLFGEAFNIHEFELESALAEIKKVFDNKHKVIRQ